MATPWRLASSTSDAGSSVMCAILPVSHRACATRVDVVGEQVRPGVATHDEGGGAGQVSSPSMSPGSRESPRAAKAHEQNQLRNRRARVAVAAFPAGALVAGLAAAQVIRRFTSGRVAVVGTVGIAALVLVAAASPTPVIVAAALFAGGACDAL